MSGRHPAQSDDAVPEYAVRGTPFRLLPLGAVKATGWLLDQLRLQASGLSGHLEEIWPDIGPDSSWLGGDGDDWERGPYYCDGLVPLAYLLDDTRLIALAQRWIDWTLASQQPDGQFGPRTNDDWWPRMVMLKALIQYHEATGDPRVIGFMTRYFQYQLEELPQRPLSDWGEARGADNVLSVYWLYERTHERRLLELARLLLDQTTDWGAYLEALPARDRVTTFDHLTHVVNVAMGIKTPACRYLADGAAHHRQLIDAGIDNLLRYHGQVEGIFSGDEWLAGTDPVQGVELCAVVELMFSLEHLVRIYGDIAFADRLEVLAFNALASTITADMRAHQYDQQPNQVLCTVAPRAWTFNDDTSNTFGLEPHYGCCTANMHQGWPKLTSSLWMQSEDGGLAAVAYAPSIVTTRLPSGLALRVEEQTEYPFDDTVHFAVHVEAPSAYFHLRLRVPGWCAAARVRVNGHDSDVGLDQLGYAVICRDWEEGDTVDLTLPMAVRAIQRPHGAIGVALGPLIFGLKIGEEWTRIPGSQGFGDWEVRPTTAWNYALAANPDRDPAAFHIERATLGALPFAGEQPALSLRCLGYRVPGWGLVQNSAGPVPEDLLPIDTSPVPITLVPYGCARLRIAEFPCVP